MDLQQRINAFAKLGQFIRQFSTKDLQIDPKVEANDLFFDGFKHQIKLAKEHNGWFTEANVRFSLDAWANALTEAKLNQWVNSYPFKNLKPITQDHGTWLYRTVVV